MNLNTETGKVEFDGEDVCIKKSCGKQIYSCTLYNLVRMMNKSMDILVRECQDCGRVR